MEELIEELNQQYPGFRENILNKGEASGAALNFTCSMNGCKTGGISNLVLDIGLTAAHQDISLSSP